MVVQGTELVGTWQSAPNDTKGASAYGNVTLKFGGDGTLLYIIHESDRDQIMRLAYRTEPGLIITDQPSEPRSERGEGRGPADNLSADRIREIAAEVKAGLWKGSK